MSSHEVRIGSKVISSDNKNLGEVHRLVIDPQTKMVTAIVFQAGVMGTERIADIDLIASSDAEGVQLSIPESEANQLTPFVHETVTHVDDWRNVAFGAGPVYSTGSVRGPVAYSPGSYGMPVPEPFFSTAPIGTLITETVGELPEGDTDVGKGTEVRGSDGKSIGHVHDVVFDDNQQITGFVVESGFIFHKETQIPIDSVAGIAHDHLRLNMTADEARARFGQ
jgi:uncharacterized protein YrrD